MFEEEAVRAVFLEHEEHGKERVRDLDREVREVQLGALLSPWRSPQPTNE